MTRIPALPAIVHTVLLIVRNLAIAAIALAVGLVVGLGLVRDQTLPVTAIGLTAYTLVILTNPLAGLVLWIVTAPFSRFWYLDIVLGRGIPDLTLTRICTGILIAVVLAQMAAGKLRGGRLIVLDGLVLAAMIGIGAALPAALDGLKSAITNFSDAYLIPAVIYILARLLVRQRKDAEMVATALIIFGAALTTVAIEEQISGRPLFLYSERSWVYSADIHRLAGLLGSPAFFATLITMCAGFAVYRFTQEPALNTRIVYLLLSVYMVAGVYVTYNRAGWLSLALNLVIMALFWPRFRRLFVAALLIGALGLALSWTTVQQSVVFRQRISASGPIEYRMEIWGRAASILSRSPITGLGYGNFGRVYLRYNPAWEKGTVLPAPHNSFLEVTFNTGLVGALPYIAMFAGIGLGILRSLRRARDQTAGEAALILAFGLAVLAYLVQAMVVDMVAAHYVNMTMMLAVGSVFGWQSEEKREHAGRHLGPVSTGFDAAGRG